MTIFGLSGFVSWSFFEKNKPESVADKTIGIFVFCVKIVICIILIPPVAIIPVIVQGQVVLLTSGANSLAFAEVFWGSLNPLSYLFGWVCFLALFVPLYSLICASIFSASIKPFIMFWSKFCNQR